METLVTSFKRRLLDLVERPISRLCTYLMVLGSELAVPFGIKLPMVF